MENKTLYFTKTKDVKSPERGTSKSAGIDFFVPNDFEMTWLDPHERIVIQSGIYVSIPEGHALIAFNKSGVATKKGLSYTAHLVDEDYRDEIGICLVNNSNERVLIEPGQKIIQFVLIPVLYSGIGNVESLEDLYFGLEESERKGGFGHTGDE